MPKRMTPTGYGSGKDIDLATLLLRIDADDAHRALDNLEPRLERIKDLAEQISAAGVSIGKAELSGPLGPNDLFIIMPTADAPRFSFDTSSVREALQSKIGCKVLVFEERVDIATYRMGDDTKGEG